MHQRIFYGRHQSGRLALPGVSQGVGCKLRIALLAVTLADRFLNMHHIFYVQEIQTNGWNSTAVDIAEVI